MTIFVRETPGADDGVTTKNDFMIMLEHELAGHF